MVVPRSGQPSRTSMEGALTNQDEWVCVHRATTRREANELGLVLEAHGIPFSTGDEHGVRTLNVHPGLADVARAELRMFLSENQSWPPREVAEPMISADGAGAAAAYAITICSMWLVQTAAAFGMPWMERGVADAAQIRDGAWWRATTALTLHADTVHLAGNTVFGAIFIAGVSQALGGGTALLAVLLSGVIGNLANAWVQSPEHSSIGASTATFGAIGILAATLYQRRALSGTRFRRWTPPMIALILLGYLGVSEGRTDVMAHVLGAVSGAVLGLLLGRVPLRLLHRPDTQGISGAIALALVVLSWFLALR